MRAGRADRLRAGLAALAVLALVAAGCAADEDGATSTTAPVPVEGGPATTTVTPTTGAVPAADAEPGDLLAVEPRTAVDVPAGARAWDVTYRSTGVDGGPVDVTGVVFAPGDEGDGTRPVVTWAHGTTGVADVCAPSLTGTAVHLLEQLLDAGYVVAATDYEGLGTEDVHPYLVGGSAGRSVLDAARAARKVPGAGAESSPATVAYGHSQGGHAVLFAGQLAPTYAPDLDLVGVAAAAPPIDLEVHVAEAASQPFAFGFFLSAAVGYAAAYPDLALEDVLTPLGVDAAGVVDEACTAVVIGALLSQPVADLLATDPTDDPDWRARIAENVPTVGEEPVPTLVVQGGRDLLVPAALTAAGVEELCDHDGVVALLAYPDADHGSVLAAAADEVLAFVEDRIAGAPPTSTC